MLRATVGAAVRQRQQLLLSAGARAVAGRTSSGGTSPAAPRGPHLGIKHHQAAASDVHESYRQVTPGHPLAEALQVPAGHVLHPVKRLGVIGVGPHDQGIVLDGERVVPPNPETRAEGSTTSTLFPKWLASCLR